MSLLGKIIKGATSLIPGASDVIDIAGGLIGGASKASGAKESAADQAAAQLAAQQARTAAAQQAVGYYEPDRGAHYGAINALTSRLGIPQTSGALSSSTTTNALSPTSDGVGMPATGATNALTGEAVQPAAVATTTQPAAAGAPALSPGTFGSTANPTWTAPAATVSSSSPATGSMATDPTATGNGAVTTTAAPGQFSYTLDDYQASPDYQWQQSEAQRATLAGAGATGSLQSGAAAKALQDRAQNIANADFTQERQFAYGLNRDQRSDYTSDRDYNRGVYTGDQAYDRGVVTSDRQYDLDKTAQDRGIYTNDRDYLTGQYNQQTQDLGNVASLTNGAVAGTVNALTGAANANANGIVASGQAQGDAAAQSADIWGNVIGNVAGTVASAANKKNALTGATTANPYWQYGS